MTKEPTEFKNPRAVAMLFDRAAKLMIGEPVQPPHEAAGEIAAVAREEREGTTEEGRSDVR